jgi:hypothetical protein
LLAGHAGKSINFLRDSCGDVAWVHDWAAASQDAAAAVGFGQVSAAQRPSACL